MISPSPWKCCFFLLYRIQFKQYVVFFLFTFIAPKELTRSDFVLFPIFFIFAFIFVLIFKSSQFFEYLKNWINFFHQEDSGKSFFSCYINACVHCLKVLINLHAMYWRRWLEQIPKYLSWKQCTFWSVTSNIEKISEQFFQQKVKWSLMMQELSLWFVVSTRCWLRLSFKHCCLLMSGPKSLLD